MGKKNANYLRKVSRVNRAELDDRGQKRRVSILKWSGRNKEKEGGAQVLGQKPDPEGIGTPQGLVCLDRLTRHGRKPETH